MTVYRERPPVPALAPWVRCLWELRIPASAEAPPRERVLPDGCMEWIFHLGPPFGLVDPLGEVELQTSALFAGTTTRAVLLAPTANGEVVGVRFHPGGAHPFLRADADAWTDRICPLGELEPGVSAMHERLADAPPDQRLDRLELELLDRSPLVRGRRRGGAERRSLSLAVARLLEGGVPVDRAADACGVGARQLQRRFRTEVGLGPKQLARIGRLQRASRLLGETSASLASIAHGAGFADQAHFVREFRAFAGTTPGRYRREAHALSDAFAQGG